MIERENSNPHIQLLLLNNTKTPILLLDKAIIFYANILGKVRLKKL